MEAAALLPPDVNEPPTPPLSPSARSSVGEPEVPRADDPGSSAAVAAPPADSVPAPADPPASPVPADPSPAAAAAAAAAPPPLRRSTRTCVVQPRSKSFMVRSDSSVLRATAYDGGADEEKKLDSLYENKEEGEGSDSDEVSEEEAKTKSRKRKAVEMEAKRQARKDAKEAEKKAKRDEKEAKKNARPAKRRRLAPASGAGSGAGSGSGSGAGAGSGPGLVAGLGLGAGSGSGAGAAGSEADDDGDVPMAGGDRLNPWDHRHPTPTFTPSALKPGSVASMPRILRVTATEPGGFHADTLRTGRSSNWHITSDKPIPGMIADQFTRTEKVTQTQLAEIFVKIPTGALDVFSVTYYPIANADRVAEALENEAKAVSDCGSRKEFKAVAKRLLHPEAVTVVAQMKKAAQALGSSLIDKFKDGDFADKEKINWVTVYHDRLVSLILRGVKYELK